MERRHVVQWERLPDTDRRRAQLTSPWSSQDLVETPSASFMCGLELLWAHAAEMTVATGSIVEAIDVIGHVVERQCSVLVNLLLDPFLLEAAES
jgi:hypothetical protein